MLAIPNTNINNPAYDGNDQGPHTFRLDADFVTGWICVANSPVYLRVTVWTGAGFRTLDEVLLPPSVTPFQVSEGGQPIRKLEFRSSAGATNAQIFGAFFTRTEPGQSPNGINFGISSTGGFIPPVSTVQFQQTGVPIGSEGIANFDNSGNVQFSLVDQPANLRVTITANAPIGPIKIAENLLGVAAASVTLPAAGTIAAAIAAVFCNAANYHTLRLVWTAATNAAVINDLLRLRFNGDAGANYDTEVDHIAAGAITNDTNAAAGIAIGLAPLAGASAGANSLDGGQATIPNFDRATLHKIVAAYSHNVIGTAAGNFQASIGGGRWRNTAAITSLTLLPQTGSFIAGSYFALYAE